MGRATFYDWVVDNNRQDLLNHLVKKNLAHEYGYMSHEKVQWVCNEGHVFERPFAHVTRVNTKSDFNCPICTGRIIIVGYNDLATTRPDLAAEWDYERNDLTPQQVTKGSHKDIWWKCSYGHSWKARISARDYGNGCPHCSKVKRSSIPEQVVFYYVKKFFSDAISRKRFSRVEADIYIPSRKIAIEYDGSIWHTNNDHAKKSKYFEKYAVTLLTISGVPTASGTNVFSYDDKQNNGIHLCNDFFVCLSNVLSVLGVSNVSFNDLDNAISFAKDEFYSSCNSHIEITSAMRKMWSDRLNGYSIDCMSNDSLDKYWVCEYGHTFKRRYDVFRKTDTCPYCTGMKAFRFYLICTNNSEFIVLDKKTMELESVSSNELISYIRDSSVSIKGVLLSSNNDIKFNDYYSTTGRTDFYKVFNSANAEKMIMVGNQTEYLIYAFKVINYLVSNLSITKCKPAMEYLFMTGNADKYVSRANLLSIK